MIRAPNFSGDADVIGQPAAVGAVHVALFCTCSRDWWSSWVCSFGMARQIGMHKPHRHARCFALVHVPQLSMLCTFVVQLLQLATIVGSGSSCRVYRSIRGLGLPNQGALSAPPTPTIAPCVPSHGNPAAGSTHHPYTVFTC